MADLIEALHRRTFNTDTLLDLLGRISRQAVRLLDGVEWAGITAQFDGVPVTAASTDRRVLILDEYQYGADDGPCLRAMRTGTCVAMGLPQLAQAWPLLASAARRAGVRSVLAVPLHIYGQPVGALNLYSAGAAVPAPDPDFLTVLTEYAGRRLTDFHTSQQAPTTAEALHTALAHWSVVEQAIGVLMTIYGFNAEHASAVLSDQAHDRNRTLREHAAHIISDHTPPNLTN